MKIGAENKKQVRWMIALLAILLLVGIYNFVDFGTSSAASCARSRACNCPRKQQRRRHESLASAPQLA